MNHLKNATILVLGLGESGLAMARWCARDGAQVRVWDTRENPPNAAALAEQVRSAKLLRGALTAEALAGVSLVLRSPGLPPHDERIKAPLAQATAAGVPVHGELELFMRALADLKAERGYAPSVIAITGTNGKTTTTAMAAQLIARTGRRVAAAGNIGATMLGTLEQALGLDAAGAAPGSRALPEVWVLELSSFQLHGVQGFEPDAATVLNITQDHLDWHGSMQAYCAAKARVFGTQAVMVINHDDPSVEALVPPPHATASGPPPAGKRRAGRVAARQVVRFGLGAPTRAGDFGMVVDHGMAWLVRALEADETLRRARAPKGGVEVEPQELHLQRLMPADALRVRGRHNAANALAALALATAIGCPLAPLLHGLREYRGEPHRVELIARLGGVDAFDDSKGTNVGATVAALAGLGADKAPGKLVVILGGDGKGQDFAPLVEPVRLHARAVATLGRDAARIEQALVPADVPLQRHATLEQATRWCFTQALPGDAVLLSPACASLDMFRDYAHRAEVFAQEVRALAAQAGGVAV